MQAIKPLGAAIPALLVASSLALASSPITLGGGNNPSPRSKSCASMLSAGFVSTQSGSNQFVYTVHVHNKMATSTSFRIGLTGFPSGVTLVGTSIAGSVAPNGDSTVRLGQGSAAELSASTVLITYDGGGSGRTVVNLTGCS